MKVSSPAVSHLSRHLTCFLIFPVLCGSDYSLEDVLNVVALQGGDLQAALNAFKFTESMNDRLDLISVFSGEVRRLAEQCNNDRKTASKPVGAARIPKRRGPTLRGEARAKR